MALPFSYKDGRVFLGWRDEAAAGGGSGGGGGGADGGGIMPPAPSLDVATTPTMTQPATTQAVVTPELAIQDVNKIQQTTGTITDAMRAQQQYTQLSRENLSIVDYLNSKGQPSSFAARTELAKQMGIQNYTGTADQNIQMLRTLQNAAPPTETKPGEAPSGEVTQEESSPEIKARIDQMLADAERQRQGVKPGDVPQEEEEQFDRNSLIDIAINSGLTDFNQILDFLNRNKEAGQPAYTQDDITTYLGTNEGIQFKLQSNQIQNQLDEQHNKFQADIDKLKAGTIPLTPAQQAQVDGLKAAFDQLKQQQLLANKNYEGALTQAGIVSGRQRYAPEIQAGELFAAISTGIQKIADIDSKASMAVAQLTQGFQTDNFEIIRQSYDEFSSYLKDKAKIINDLHEKTVKAVQEARDFNYKVQQDKIANQMLSDKFAFEMFTDERDFALRQEMENRKFDYQMRQDMIENALAQQKITIDQANDLRDYNLKLKQLEQSKYIVSKDALGRAFAFDTKTGEFKTSELYLGEPAAVEGTINAYKDAFASVLHGFKSVSERNLQSARLDQLLEAGDLSRAREMLLKLAAQASGIENEKTVIGRVQGIDSLAHIKSLLDMYVKKSGDTGIWKGTIEEAANRIGLSSDEALSGMKTTILQFLGTYRRSLTGAAFGQGESAEYASLMPDIKNASTLNTAKINALMEAMNRNQESFYKYAIGEQNYKEIFGSQPKYSSLKEVYISVPELQGAIDQIKQEHPEWSDDDILQVIEPEINRGFNKPLSMGENGSPAGTLAAQYESGGNPGAIGFDRTGGWSYGVYQLAHNSVNNFLQGSPFNKFFAGLRAGTEAFNNKWRQVAAQYGDAFKHAQQQFINKTHYQPQVSRLEKLGININRFSSVLKEIILSTAIQHGGNTDVIEKAIRRVGMNAPESELVKAIYNERWSGGRRFVSSTAAVKRAVFNRFFGKNGELNKALAMLRSNIG